VQVESLPRDVDIEWHSTGLSSCKLEILDSPSINGGGHVIRVLGTDTRFFSIDITSVDSVEAVKNRLGDFVWEHATLYASAGLGLSSGYASVVEALQWIPCKRVWGADGVEVRGVIVGRCTLQ
jgi:diphthine-ammonia ligase